eukprot:scaffold43468_cov22-Tisochrysis_lutea.AAC.1
MRSSDAPVPHMRNRHTHIHTCAHYNAHSSTHTYTRPHPRFDFLVTCASLVEMLVELAPGSDNAAFNGGLTAIRLLRLFRLARYWAGLSRILRVLSHAFTSG